MVLLFRINTNWILSEKLKLINNTKYFLEVSSTDVTVNGSTITLEFPNGLTSDSDLSGRNWEILMTREAFMDEAGNYFADSQTVGNLVMKDNGTYASTLNNYSFRNTLVKDENLVLLKVGNSYNFNSAGVAKPVFVISLLVFFIISFDIIVSS